MFRPASRVLAMDVSAPERRIRILLATLGCIVSFTGCSTLSRVYVHDPDAQKAAEAAQTTWKGALPSSIFDQQKAYLARLAADEVVTAKIQIAAQRDLELTYLIDGTSLDRVGKSLQDRLQLLTGSTRYRPVTALDQKVNDDRVSIDNLSVQVSLLTTKLKQDGYKGALPTCDHTQSSAAGITDNQHVDLNSIKTLCDSLTDKRRELTRDIGAASQAGKGELVETLQALEAATGELAQQQQQAAALQQVLDAKKKEIDQAKAGSQAARDAEAVLRFCLADPGTGSDTQAAQKPATADLGDVLKDCEVRIGQTADPLVKQLKHTALRDEIQSVLTALLNAKLPATGADAGKSSGTTVSQPSIAASTTAALRTLDSLAGVADAIGTRRQPSVNALLVALAYEQFQADLNAAEVATLKQRISIYEERRDACISEISFIARAQEELAKAGAKRDIGRVRSYVNGSWNIGAYRVLLTQYAQDDLTRADSLRISSTIAIGWQNILQPAFDELAAYGKGGLDAQTVSNLIVAVVNAGGFAAVAKGVN